MLATVSATANADFVLYRFTDEHGKVTMSSTLPPEVVKNGYEVLNASGRVIQVVAPALTPEQILERDRIRAAEKAEEESAAQRAEEDRQLLRQYPRLADVIRARERRLNEIDTLISYKVSGIASAKKRRSAFLDRAADTERLGRAVPEEIQTSIEREASSIDTMEREIEELQRDRELADRAFLERIERIRYLTGAASKDPIP